jgi:hypothetical protein
MGTTSGHQPDHAALTRQTSEVRQSPRPARENKILHVAPTLSHRRGLTMEIEARPRATRPTSEAAMQAFSRNWHRDGRIS